MDQLLVAGIVNYFRIVLTGRKAVGCNFFTKNNFGDWTHTLQVCRDQLNSGKLITIHFLYLEEQLLGFIDDVNTSITR